MMLKTKKYIVVILKAIEEIKKLEWKKSAGNMEEEIFNQEKMEFCPLFAQLGWKQRNWC